MLTIGRNTALNRIRGRKRREARTESLDDPAGTPAGTAVAPVEPVVTRSVPAGAGRAPRGPA